MNDKDYELLSSYLDGELSASAAQTLRKRLLAEPELRAAFESLRAVNDKLRESFDTEEAKAVPEHITVLVSNAPTTEEARPDRRRAAWGFAVAASLVAATGLLLTPDWRQAGAPAPGGDDPLLAQTLEQAPSRAEGWENLADGRQLRPMLSFQSKSGEWCREFLISDADSSWRGVACRDDSGWQTEAIGVQDVLDHGAQYRPAGAAQAAEVDAYIDANAADIPLSLSQEAELIARGWR